MGVDYSTTVGYGFVFKEDELPPALKALADGDYLGEEHVQPWLEENGLDLLTTATVGNFMCGETFILLCLEDTYQRFDIYDAEGVHKMSVPLTSGQEQTQLYKLRGLLDTADLPEWVVAFNIS
jgi:hypothetical protein